jgi:amino acid permease
MKGDVSTLAGVLIIITVSLVFGFVLVHQGQLLSETVKYTPSGIEDLKSLQDALHNPEPTPLKTPDQKP